MNPLTDITNPMSIYNNDTTATTTVAVPDNQIKLTNTEGFIILGSLVVAAIIGALLVRLMNKC